MPQFQVIVDKLNKRKTPVIDFTDKSNIAGVVLRNYSFESDGEISNILGRWIKDRDGYYYWGKGLRLDSLFRSNLPVPAAELETPAVVEIENELLSKLQINEIWQAGEMGDKAIVAILDSGIALKCSDLEDAVSNGIEGGFSDSSNRTKIFLTESASLDDDIGHGSHCAGIIASRNKLNNVGIAKQCILYVGKITDKNNSPSGQNIIKGLRWAGGLDDGSPQDIDIISLSAGSLLNLPDMKPIVDEILNRGKIIVCSIGNRDPRSLPSGGTYPAMFAGVISVGALDFNDKFQDFSYEFDGLTICCPGTNINSYWVNGETHIESGTSQSTAVCAGVIALLVSKLKKRGEHNIGSKIIDCLSNAKSTMQANGFKYRFLEPFQLYQSI